MKRTSLLGRIVHCTAIALIMSLLPWTAAVQTSVQAAGPDLPQGWVSFGEPASPQAANLTLTASKSSSIDLHASVPGAWGTAQTLLGAEYAVLSNDGLLTGHAQGLPDLPVIRQEVEIPFGATYSLEVTAVQSRSASLSELGLPAQYFPAQPSQPKCGEAVAPCAPDAKLYASKEYYPAEAVRVISETIQRGHRLLTVEIWPVAYNPAAGMLRLSSDIQFSIHLQGSDMALTRAMAERYASPAFEKDLAGRVLNFNQGAGERDIKTPVGYLIITADAYDNADLAAFVTLKQEQGFTVTKVKQSEITNGATKEGIKAYIQNAYSEWTLPPSFVLFVGDTNSIPNWPFKTSGQTSYLTDLYHVTMDGTSDYVPDIYRGRFPVRSTAQLTNMVNNALWYDATSGAEAWVKKAAFLASDDSGYYDVAEGSHNYVISSYTQPRGYTGIFPTNPQPGGDKLYAITHGATTANVLASINDNRSMVIYSGHGSDTSWAGPGVTQAHVRNLTGVLSGYVVGHACVTADFNTAEAFSDTWVIQPGKGALVYVGASDNSYWPEDDRLERVIFDTLYANPLDVPSINEMLYAGLAAVQTGFPSRGQYYWEEYNLFGDPSAEIVLGPKMPDFTLAVDPGRLGICNDGSANAIIQVGSINDYTTPVDLSLTGAPAGLSYAIDPTTVIPAGTSALTLTNEGPAAAGSYPLTVNGISGTLNHSADLTLDIFTAIPGLPALVSPANGAMNQPYLPTLTWDPAVQASSYTLQIARDAAFSDLVLIQSGIYTTSYTLTSELLTGVKYYWRVKAASTCGSSEFSAAYHFTTLPAPGDCSPGYSPVVLHQVDFESGAGGWVDASTGTNHWALSTTQSHSPTHAQFGADVTVVADQRLVSPAVVLPAIDAGPLTFSYWNRYAFEGTTSSCWDAGLLEISTNGGTTWAQVPAAQLLTQPYNGTVSSSYSNPLAGLPAWCGDNTTWTRSVVNLDGYASQTVQFRFRLGSDSSAGDEGWFIDDALVKSCEPDEPTYGVTLTPATQAKIGEPGSSVDYTLTLTNTGNTSDTFHFSAAGNGWNAALPADVALAADASAQVTITVTLPSDAAGSDAAAITVASLADGTQTASSSLTTTAAFHAVDLTATVTEATGQPGKTLTFGLTITNQGNVEDTFQLSSLSGWLVGLPGNVTLAAGASEDVTIIVTVPLDAQVEDQEDIEISVAPIGHTASDEVILTVTVDFWRVYLPVTIR